MTEIEVDNEYGYGYESRQMKTWEIEVFIQRFNLLFKDRVYEPQKRL